MSGQGNGGRSLQQGTSGGLQFSSLAFRPWNTRGYTQDQKTN